MKQIIETERLVLRKFEMGDAEKMFELNLDPEVLKYTGDRAFASEKEASVFLRNYSEYDNNGFGRWVVLDKENAEFLGWCGLKRNEEDLVDIGFRFLRKYWNMGYATESAKACLDYGFDKFGLNTIIGRSDINNIASIKVLEKINMSFWKYGNFDGVEESVYYKIEKDI